MKRINLDGLNFGSDGRTELNSEQLRQLEASYEPSAGAGETTNSSTACRGTTNSSCKNTIKCTSSINEVSCTNSSSACMLTQNWSGCSTKREN